jgi:ABC-type transport system involved in multi-copper enzyme maturation permease subunit
MPATRSQEQNKPKGNAASNILASEWTKIRTVRSTYRTLLAAAVATIGLSAIVCAVFVAQWDGISAKDRLSIDPSSLSLTGGVLAQLAIAVLGVLVITSEYGSGMIRTTFAATPRRISVLAAKSAVFGAVTLVVTLAACFVAFFVGQLILSSKGFGVSISAPNALRTVLGTALYLTILGLLALGLGTLIRRTAGAISAVVGLIFVLPVVSSFLPASMQSIEKFLPSSAGQAILAGSPAQASTAPMLAPWTGLAVFGLYAAIALIAAAITLKRRDA